MIYFLLSTIIVPVTIGTIYFNRLPGHVKMMVAFFWLCLATEVVAYICAKTYGNNMIVYYFFVSFSAVILSLAYLKYLRSTLPLAILIVPLVAFIEALVYGTRTFNSLSFTVFNGLLLIICVYTFYRMMVGTADMSMYVMNGLFMFYALSSTFFFFSARYLQENDLLLMGKLFGFHAYINAITNLAFGCSLWMLMKSYTSAR